ncbi:hypothetical protein ACFL5Z_17375 [Planctomycetota bacterium]
MFNDGKPYHGSEAVTGGKLKGATDTRDYFYFFCPQCPDQQIMRILDYCVHAIEAQNSYNDFFKEKATEGFTLAFKLHCDKCEHTDFVKISNTGWQGGTYSEALRIYAGEKAE